MTVTISITAAERITAQAIVAESLGVTWRTLQAVSDIAWVIDRDQAPTPEIERAIAAAPRAWDGEKPNGDTALEAAAFFLQVQQERVRRMAAQLSEHGIVYATAWPRDTRR